MSLESSRSGSRDETGASEHSGDQPPAQLAIMVASEGYNMELARQISDLAGKHLNISSHILGLASLDLPLFTMKCLEDEGVPEKMQKVRCVLEEAMMFAVACPEYNGGIPPVLTNAVSWVSRSSANWRAAFQNKPTLLSSYSSGGGVRVLSALRLQFSYLGAHVLGRDVAAKTDADVEASLLACLRELKRLAALDS